MTCRLYQKDLSTYLDGELPGARAARLEEHLRTCLHCRQELDELGGIAGRIRAVSTHLEVSHDFDRRVLRSVGYWRVKGRQTQQRTLTKPLTIIAVILLGLLGLIRHFFAEPPMPAPQPQPAAIAAPAPPSGALPPGGPGTSDRGRR